MKRLCFILFFLASIVCNAQYLPVLEDGKIGITHTTTGQLARNTSMRRKYQGIQLLKE